jgi:ElaB/YqjD/DUF883 family membrane-anchored ribosome-binding protein
MADAKNDTNKTTSAGKQAAGADTGAGGKVSAGTSVGNIGEPPMPHAHDATKGAQGATASGSTATSASQASTSQASTSQASGATGSGGQQGGDKSKEQSSQQQSAQGQGGSTTDQVRQRASDAYEEASDWAQDTYERVSDWASSAYGSQRRRTNQRGGRSAKSFGNVRGGVQSYVSENPMVVGLVGLAAGMLLGALLPRTRRENEFFGEWADEVRNQGMRYAREAANRGREYVEETFSGDDAQFSRHDSEFRGSSPDANRH